MTELFYDDKKSYEQSFRHMWRTIFADPLPYESFYFQSLYAKNRVLGAKEDGKLVGMIHLNPYRMHVMDRSFDLHYIVGVATDADYRRRGIMRQMLKKVMNDMAEAGEPFTYLMPADTAYYTPFSFVTVAGFSETEYVGNTEYSGLESVSFRDYDEAIAFANQYCKEHFNVYTEIDESVLLSMKMEARAETGKQLCMKEDGKITGLAVYGRDDTTFYVRQIFGDRQMMTEKLKRYFGPVKIMMTFPDDQGEDALIMARILRLDLLMPLIRSSEPFWLDLKIVDEDVPGQNGSFHITGDEGGSHLVRLSGDTDREITIADLTRILFGRADEELKAHYPEFDQIKPLTPVMIGEIV